MWAFRIIEDQVFSDFRANLGNGVLGMLVNYFIFDCPPQPSYKDIIPLSSSAKLTAIYKRQVIASNHRGAWNSRFMRPSEPG